MCICALQFFRQELFNHFFYFLFRHQKMQFSHSHCYSGRCELGLAACFFFFRKGYLKLVLCCFLRYSIQWQSREPDQFLVCPKPYQKSQGQICNFGNILIVNIWAPGWLSRKSVRPLISGSWI